MRNDKLEKDIQKNKTATHQINGDKKKEPPRILTEREEEFVKLASDIIIKKISEGSEISKIK